MATKNYAFPTINPAAPFDGANDINKLASAIDKSMKNVEKLGQDGRYTLPAATKNKLGGVIIGDSVNVNADGVISVDVAPYELPAASRTQLGGVKIPKGGSINLESDGTISVDTQNIEIADGSITTAKIADDAITTAKINSNAVTNAKLSSELQNYVSEGQNALEGAGTSVNISAVQNSTFTNVTVSAVKFLQTLLISYDFDLTSDGSVINDTFATMSLDEIAKNAITAAHVDLAVGSGSLTNKTIKIQTAGTGAANVVRIVQTQIPAGTYHVNGSIQMFFES